MIQHIDVHAVLRESVSAMYADLVTRPTGRVVRERIERAIARADGRGDVTIARIDFTGVGCIDYSCADEIVAKLLRGRPAVLVLSGLADGHREAIDSVLTGHGLAALLGMLNSCASGVSVVNIDNGFGAAAIASLINHL